MFNRTASKALTRQLDRLWPDLGLRAKMSVLVVAATLFLIGLFAYLGTVALEGNRELALQDRVVLAQATASQIDSALVYIDYVLRDAATREDWSNPEQIDLALERTQQRLQLHATHVFLTDDAGRVIASKPPITSPLDLSQHAAVSNILHGQPFAVSRAQRPLNSIASTVAAAPVRNSSDAVTHALVTDINLTDSPYVSFIQSMKLGDSGYVDLVDLSGWILASTYPARVDHTSDPADNLSEMIHEQRPTFATGRPCFVSPSASASASCREVLAFAPLDHAPWGVAVRQREDEVFASAHTLQIRLFALMAACVAGDLIAVYLTTRAVIHPVQALTDATRRIAAGDMDTPIPTSEKDEIGLFASSFELMRVRLKERSRNLDTQVREAAAESRTALKQNAVLYAELQEKEQMRRELLHRVFSAQEEERKRISRELHDETCQILNSLAYDLDNVGEMLEHGEASSAEIQPMLEKMRSLAKTGRDGVSRIIFDLRPTMLDHLGLVPALRWYAEMRMGDLKIHYSFREMGHPHRLLPSVETALFRVIQETVNNIAQHSHAGDADFVFEYFNDRVEVRVADDGRGFEPTAIEDLGNGWRGLGLMGMEERMTAVGGRFRLQSAPGKGTVVQLSVPQAYPAPSQGTEGASHGQDPSLGRG